MTPGSAGAEQPSGTGTGQRRPDASTGCGSGGSCAATDAAPATQDTATATAATSTRTPENTGERVKDGSTGTPSLGLRAHLQLHAVGVAEKE